MIFASDTTENKYSQIWDALLATVVDVDSSKSVVPCVFRSEVAYFLWKSEKNTNEVHREESAYIKKHLIGRNDMLSAHGVGSK